MAGRDSANKQSRNATARRRLLFGMGAGAGVFLAAAAMATGSLVTAAPAKADIDALLDPIIQPIVTSLSDAIAGFDPAAATDLTSWTDSLLASLNSIDLALPTTAESAASAASSTSAAAASGSYDIPLTVNEVTEPTVQATIDGSSAQTLLVDTGSSGLVIPYTDLGLTQLFDLGFPTGLGESGYSGGVDYLYLTYDNASVDYGGVLTTPNTPIEVEFLSWPTSFSAGSPLDFQQFLTDDQVTGILGVGPTGTGPATSPLESVGFNGVAVNIPGHDLVVDSTNPGTAIGTVGGAPIPTLYEVLTTPGAGGTTTSASVSNDIDSGGVYGTIPSSLVGNAGSVPLGSTISVYTSPGGTELYSYTTTIDSLNQNTGPTVVSGTSIDSGVIPYLNEPIYINYTADTLSFDNPLPAGYNLP
ncbi:PecA family PE domain-processing aspartic protease [Mycobacterium sp.]|uniref:PecA family PE domain-processing aspartic protease n=1 Tax=Mycobacterium sp. TaxID=1785 RepID=UPI003F9C953C